MCKLNAKRACYLSSSSISESQSSNLFDKLRVLQILKVNMKFIKIDRLSFALFSFIKGGVFQPDQ